MPVIYGRSIRHLTIIWIATIGSMALLHYFETSAPAFHELLIPFYWIALAIALVLTWRWLRSRSTKDRRGRDRRHASRREDSDSSQAAAPERDVK